MTGTPEDTAAVAGDTLSATLRAMSAAATDIAASLKYAADIRDGEPCEDADKAVTLIVRRATRLVIDLRQQIRRFPPLTG